MVAQQQQAPATTHKAPLPVPEGVKRLEAMLTGMTRDFEAALPAAAKSRVGDFLRLALVDVPRNKGLMELAASNPARIMIALMDIARLGLVPGSRLGEAWVVPFAVGRGADRRPDCQAIIGYQGYLKLARNSGLIESIVARAVYQGDRFEIRYGLHEDIIHEPGPRVNRADPSLVIGCYAIARFKGGGHHIEWMSDDEILLIARRSKSYDQRSDSWSGPWQTDWIEMAKKTVIRRAQKQWPKSVEMAEAIALDERAEIIVEPEAASTRPALENNKPFVFDVNAFSDHEPEPVGNEREAPAETAKEAPAPAAASKPAATPAAKKEPAKKAAAQPATTAETMAEIEAAISATEKAEILRREREEYEREANARDRARGD